MHQKFHVQTLRYLSAMDFSCSSIGKEFMNLIGNTKEIPYALIPRHPFPSHL